VKESRREFQSSIPSGIDMKWLRKTKIDWGLVGFPAENLASHSLNTRRKICLLNLHTSFRWEQVAGREDWDKDVGRISGASEAALTKRRDWRRHHPCAICGRCKHSSTTAL